MIMFGILIAVVTVFGIVLLVALYMLFLTSLYPETIRTDEIFYIRTNDLWILRVCRYRKGRASGEPVLLVHGMGANQNNFTSPEGNCLVDYLSEKGYDCWTIDLGGSRSSEAPFERTRDDVCLEDFFKEDIPAAIAHILKITNYEKLHWIGHSMGGMLLYAHTFHSGGGDIVSGTTLGSPIDFTDAAGKVPTLALAFAEKFPSVSGSAIRGLVPILKTLHVGTFAFPINQRNLPASMSAGHFINMLEDPLPSLMRQVRQWIVSRDYKLLNGSLDIVARIDSLPVPLFAFFAAKDPFINAERAKEWFGSIKNPDKKMVICSKDAGYVEDYSHCDLAFSKAAQKEIFEPIGQWLEAHPCPVRASIKDEVERFSTSQISEDKRAKILSGNAYAHITDTEAQQSKTEEEREEAADNLSGEDVSVDEAAVAVAPKKKAVTKKAAAQKAPVKKKATPKKTTDSPKASAKKKSVAKKKLAATKKATVTSKAPTLKASVAKVQDALEEEGPSPEALKKANQAREERNSVFSELMASLSKPLEPES